MHLIVLDIGHDAEFFLYFKIEIIYVAIKAHIWSLNGCKRDMILCHLKPIAVVKFCNPIVKICNCISPMCCNCLYNYDATSVFTSMSIELKERLNSLIFFRFQTSGAML